MFCSEIKKEHRRNVCDLCPHKRGHFMLFGIVIFKRVSQCKICKCSLLLKTALEDAKCPRGKW